MVIAFKNDRIALMDEKERALRTELANATCVIQTLEGAKVELIGKISTLEGEIASLKTVVESKELDVSRRDEVIRQYENHNNATRIEIKQNLDKAKKMKELEEINLLITNYRRQQVYE